MDNTALDNQTLTTIELPGSIEKEILSFNVDEESTIIDETPADSIVYDSTKRKRISNQLNLYSRNDFYSAGNDHKDVILQRFDGVVLNINHKEGFFTVRLTDLTHPERPDDLAEISFEELEGNVAKNISEGDTIYWQIGTTKSQSTSPHPLSKISVKRFLNFTKRELDLAHEESKELADFFRK